MVARGKTGIFKSKTYHALMISYFSYYFQVLFTLEEHLDFKFANKHPS
jgi:hypothetical protein